MRKERKELKIADIELNKGQLAWLPQNPRQWTKADIERTAKSIEEDPDFLEDRPLLVVAFGKKYVVFGGNLRREGCKKLGKATAPAVEYFPETQEDFDTVIRRSLKDNGSFGAWDYDILANEYDDLALEDYGLKVWDDKTEAQKQMENGGLSTKGAEGDEEESEKDSNRHVVTLEFSTPEQKDEWLKYAEEQGVKICKGLNWGRGEATEHRCNLKPRLKEYKQEHFNYMACFHNTESGERLSVIKTGMGNVKTFAEQAIIAIRSYIGEMVEGVQLVCAPARRHKENNFAENVCKEISRQTGIVWEKGLILMASRDRFHPEFYLLHDVDAPIVVIYDDIVTSGKTIMEMHRLFEDKTCYCVVGIENDRILKEKQ